MNPPIVAVLLLVSACYFTRHLWLRWRTLVSGPAPSEDRFDRPMARLRRTLGAVFGHAKVRQYPLYGGAHLLVFLGFIAFGARSLILLGRGFDPGFNAWVLAPGTPLGDTYARLKDIFLALTLLGTLGLGYQRVIRRPSRLSLNAEGLVILGIIVAMMLADLFYDGACLALLQRGSSNAGELLDPFGSLESETPALSAHPLGAAASHLLLRLRAGEGFLVATAQLGYFTHVALLCTFLAYIPRSKHLHILTAPINLYTARLGPRGKLPSLATGAEKLVVLVEAALESHDELDAPVGIATLDHLTWKDRLDLLSCTECGRCTEHCPAARSGLALTPKALMLSMRGALYGPGVHASAKLDSVSTLWLHALQGGASLAPQSRGVLVPGLVSNDAVWACTTCGACEQECPVGITFVDKIVQMRRHLVTIRGELPAGLGRPFEALAANHNPWNASPLDRLRWAAGQDVPLLADVKNADVLLWVGCAPAYDVRAQRVARSVATLLRKARVSFAVLGVEERCTGDVARRSGNEMLFLELAESNIETLERYRATRGFRRIVTLCPHCHNTLKHEYCDLGGHYDVIPHTTYLLELLQSGRLIPKRPIARRLTFHDPCYLTRHSGLGAAPREVLRRIAAHDLLECNGASGGRAECCGGGGAQGWLDRRGPSRTNERRATQLAATGASTVVSACPFCLAMLSDGMTSADRNPPTVSDLAELLCESCCPPEPADTGGATQSAVS